MMLADWESLNCLRTGNVGMKYWLNRVFPPVPTTLVLYKYEFFEMHRKSLSQDITHKKESPERDSSERSYLFCWGCSRVRDEIEPYGKLLLLESELSTLKWVICNQDSRDRILIKFKIHHKVKLHRAQVQWHHLARYLASASEFSRTLLCCCCVCKSKFFTVDFSLSNFLSLSKGSLNPRKCPARRDIMNAIIILLS